MLFLWPAFYLIRFSEMFLIKCIFLLVLLLSLFPFFISTVKRTSSAERVSPGGRRESYGDSKGSRNRTGSTSSSSSGKKNSERQCFLNGHLGFLPSALTVKFVSFSENTGTSVFINLYQLVKNTYLKRLRIFFFSNLDDYSLPHTCGMTPS